jgi:hypothetical protein
VVIFARDLHPPVEAVRDREEEPDAVGGRDVEHGVGLGRVVVDLDRDRDRPPAPAHGPAPGRALDERLDVHGSGEHVAERRFDALPAVEIAPRIVARP